MELLSRLTGLTHCATTSTCMVSSCYRCCYSVLGCVLPVWSLSSMAFVAYRVTLIVCPSLLLVYPGGIKSLGPGDDHPSYDRSHRMGHIFGGSQQRGMWPPAAGYAALPPRHRHQAQLAELQRLEEARQIHLYEQAVLRQQQQMGGPFYNPVSAWGGGLPQYPPAGYHHPTGFPTNLPPTVAGRGMYGPGDVSAEAAVSAHIMQQQQQQQQHRFAQVRRPSVSVASALSQCRFAHCFQTCHLSTSCRRPH
jgi:hypothetical protein